MWENKGNTMEKGKAARNKTIDTPLSEGGDYLARCVCMETPTDSITKLLDRTILGDSFVVLPLLPKACADLVIADPPYNLRKSYNGHTFARRTAEEYEDYTRRWLSLVSPLLKPEGSIYVCCDWESSLIIGRVLGDFFTVRNRITWQREKGRGAKANWKNSLEDIWFATKGEHYTFNLDAVKQRRRVIAPYRVDGRPKDWTETASGKIPGHLPLQLLGRYQRALLVHAGEHGAPHAKAGKADRQADPGKLQPGRPGI